MQTLDYKAFFWEAFDKDKNPINPKECQIIFNPKDGGKLLYFLGVNEGLGYNDVKDKIIRVLYGQVSGGKRFTLYNLECDSVKPQFTANIYLTEVEFSVKYIFYDGWIDIDKQLQTIHVRYSYLELWFNQLEITKEFDDNKQTIAGIKINKEYLKCSNAEYNVLFNIENGFSRSSFNNRIVNYETTNSLAIEKKDNLNFDEAVELALTIKSFFEIMTFYSNNKIFIEKFYIVQQKKLKSCLEIDEIVYLLFKQDGYVNEKQMSHIDFLLRYKDIKDNFVQVLNNWIKKHDNYQNEYNAFCSVISNKNTKFNIYTHYFQLISALEGYHRNNYINYSTKKKKEEETEYINKLTGKLKNCLNRNERKSLFKKLSNFLNITLKERLLELVKKSDIQDFVKLEDKIYDELINFIINTRNDIGHLKKTLKINSQIKSSFEYIKILTLLLMMKDISLNQTHISKHILDYDLDSIKTNLIDSFSKTENS